MDIPIILINFVVYLFVSIYYSSIIKYYRLKQRTKQ